MCRILHKSGDKKNPNYPNQTCFRNPSTPTSFIDVQTLETPIETPPLHISNNSTNHPSSLPLLAQEEEVTVSSFIEAYLQNPLVYGMGLGPLGVYLGAPPSDELPLMGPTPFGASGPSVL